MQVNPQQLLDDGFIILRNVIPPEQLNELRDSFEVLLGKQKKIWAAERKPDEPPGGAWDTSAQPRVFFNTVVDKETANAAGFCLHENTLGVSRQLMQAPDAAVTLMALMCSPPKDYGPASWHRDMDPIEQAPMRGLQTDMLTNAPGYVQWNIPLYDDSVLWVVPGSHSRPNTDVEHQHLLTNPQKPIPGGIPVELNAGDGVVYSNLILHWGSNYSSKLRRTIHLGYRSFGGAIFPYVNHHYWKLDFTAHLLSDARAHFERFAELHKQRCDVIESTFRAILNKDETTFREGLATLHPGADERMVTVVLLCRWADKVRKLKSPDILNLPLEERVRAVSEHRLNIHLFEEFATRFSQSEADTLWERFETLDAQLQADAERSVPDFGSQPMRYLFTEMPANFDLEHFIASWDSQK